MAREVWHHSMFTVIWQLKIELAWQSLVTTVKAERQWKDMNLRVLIYEMFVTQKWASLSWQVSPESHRIVNSLSSTSVTVHFCFTTRMNMDGGCHVILLRWRTGAEHLAMVSAHAGWPTRVQIPVMAVTVTRMTMYGVKTAVSLLTRPSFLWNNSGLEILVKAANKVTIHSENWSALGQHKWRLLFQTKKARGVCSVISSEKQVIVETRLPLFTLFRFFLLLVIAVSNTLIKLC